MGKTYDNIDKLPFEWLGQGYGYKNAEVFLAGDSYVCYISEYSYDEDTHELDPESCYTRADFVKLTGGLEKPIELFNSVDWQHPSSLWNEGEALDDEKEKENKALEETEPLSYYQNIQRAYLVGNGGPCGIRESDETYNDLNRKLIVAYRDFYGAAYWGKINYHDSQQRQWIVNGEERVYVAYAGQKLYNFCCDFCIPAPDPMLEELIQQWNNADLPNLQNHVKKIMDRIDELDGLSFIWF